MKRKYGTILVSDTHVTTYFDKRKFNYLEDLFSRCDQIIFNGDFWSYYSLPFEKFLSSKWRELFPSMKQKNCVYIYGNHDRDRWCDERTSLFSVEAVSEYRFQRDNIDLLITHGHLIAKDSIQNETYIRFNRIINNFNKLNQSFRFYILMQRTMIKILGDDKYSTLYKKMNDSYKSYARALPKGQILVTAHTHAPEFLPTQKYINIGFINFGLAYFLNVQDGKLQLIKERYF